MLLPLRAFFFLLSVISALADFLGPTYPAPVDLTSDDSLVYASWKNLSSFLDASLKENEGSAPAALSGWENVTFSAGLFSTHDPGASNLQYHYTSPEIANSSVGTKEVDGSSIYRIASVSKLFTVFAGLLELTDEEWNLPLTDVIPGLADVAPAEGTPNGPLYTTQWGSVTPWALATQLSGVARQGIPSVDLLFLSEASAQVDEQNATDPVKTYGFPPARLSELGPCAAVTDLFCTADDYIGSVRSQPPAFLPWTTPAYSNNGLILLGIVISNLADKSMSTIYREVIFEPLGMTSSSSTVPTGEAELARSVIAGDPVRGFAIDGGITVPSGGLFSSIDDLAKFGVGILNSTILPADRTRKWMKPATHTASLSYSVGAPWEIIRYIHPSTGKVSDLYTKLGDAGFYGGSIVLIPDYHAGFSILAANTNSTLRSTVTNTVLDLVTEEILPALEAQAATEAERHFAGTYVSQDPTELNSSLTISFNQSSVEGTSSGLSISRWISNGTDVLASPLFAGIKPRLLPSIPDQSAGAGQVAFQASTHMQTSTYAATTDPGVGPFTGQMATNLDWLVVDEAHYAGFGVNLFVFDVNEGGKAISAYPAVTRVKLERDE